MKFTDVEFVQIVIAQECKPWWDEQHRFDTNKIDDYLRYAGGYTMMSGEGLKRSGDMITGPIHFEQLLM